MKPSEINDYQRAIREALSLLGKENLSLIAHGSSFPSASGEDTGMGSPNAQGAKDLVQFVKTMGFNSIQLGPAGKTKGVDASPYTATCFSNNPLFIELKALVSDPQWCGILSQETFDTIVQNHPNPNTNRTAYGYLYPAQEQALKEAFQTFQAKRQQIDTLPAEEQTRLRDLDARFQDFKSEQAEWLENDALYEALTALHGNDYWPVWPQELDKRLLNPATPEEAAAAQARIQEVKAQQAEVMEGYAFTQFIADAQKTAMQSYNEATGVHMLADRQVAFSDRDVWAYQSVFLDGFSLGAPPDYFSEDGQSWGFPIIDPRKIVAEDGTLLEGGKLLKTLFSKLFRENRGGVRIDHIIGLVDPWVYPQGQLPKIEEGAGRLYSSPEHPVLGAFSRVSTQDLDPEETPDAEGWIRTLTPEQVEQYATVLRLVIQAAEEQGLDKNAIICEDLGTLTTPVKQVMETLGLSGMRVTQFVDPNKPNHLYRGKNVGPNEWIMAGTHDNEPLATWTDRLFETNQTAPHLKNLSEDLLPANASEQDREALRAQMSASPKALVAAKFAELFASASKHVQVFFADFLGIRETYNRPGTSGDQNWSLRIPNNFETFYYDQLANNDGMNLPEILLLAMKSRGPAFLQDNASLVASLERYQEILKQPNTVLQA
jgi:4-alpha-glucanotransferase